MNLNQLFENTNSGGNYAEDLAKQVFDANPNIRDENQILDAAWPLAVTALGNKRAMSVFNYDADFPSDLVSVYGWLQKDQQGLEEAGFPGAPDVEMPPMKPSGDPQRDKLKQEYMDLHHEIKSLVDIPYRSDSSPEQKMQAKARIKQLNDRADQIKAILEPRQPPNEWQKKTYGYDDNWNRVGKGVAEGSNPEKVEVRFSAKEYAAMSPAQKAAKQEEWQQLKQQAKMRMQNFTLIDTDKEQGVAEGSEDRSRFIHFNTWTVMDSDEEVMRHSVERDPFFSAKKLMRKLDDEGYDFTHVISPEGRITYSPQHDPRHLRNFPVDEEQLSEIGNTPTGRAALGAVQNRAYDTMDAWSANPKSGYSSTPKDVDKATSAGVAAGNRLHGFGPDNSRENTVMARDALRQKQALRQTQGMAEGPMWQDDPEHLEYKKKQADISGRTGLAVGDLVTLKDRPGFKGKIVHDWGGGDFTISGAGGGMSQSNNHRANARLIQKMQGVTEGMDDSPVAGAITRRIMLQRADLLSKYGPEKVLNAIDEVADFVGDAEEIGSSDVSGWVRQVEQTLDRMGQGLGEAGGRNYHANTTGFARGARDPEGLDPAPDAQTWYIRLNGKLIRDKQGMPYSFRGKAAANKAAVTMQAKLFNQGKEFVLTTNPNDPQQGVTERFKEAANAKQQAAIAIAKKKELAEFAPPSGNDGDSGRWYTDDELADIIGDDWFEDFDVSHDGFNIDAYGEKAKQNLVDYANSWFDDRGYNVNVLGVEHNDVDHDLKWYIVGSFYNPGFANKGVAEGEQPGKSVTDAIQKVMPIAQEIWFHGSRATGKHRKNSDTDILVVVPDDLIGDQYLGVVRILQKLSSHFDNYDIQPTKVGTNIHRIAQEEGQLLWSNKQGVEEGKQRMSRAAKGWEKYGDGMIELSKAAKNGAGEKEMDAIRKKHNKYDNKSITESKSKPSNLLLWEQAQSVASSKFDSRLTEAADQWAKIWYKNKGGVWQ